MFDEYQVVRLKHSVQGIPAGTLGAVVMVYPGQPPGYEVEFCNGDGVTLAVITLHDEELIAAPDAERRGG